jgi:hypothetical protein
MNANQPSALPSVNNCGVCARPLVYTPDSITSTCALCGKVEKTNIYCPAGHYVCNTCHSKAALEVLKEILSTTQSTDPAAIMEQVLSHPAVPMHGPEHHVIVPAAIVTAAKNAGYAVPEGALDKVIERASKFPGGWCGLYGDCGAAVGAGIAVSVLTGATPLTGKPRTLAMAATSQAMATMLDEQPRCCKKATRRAIQSAVEFLRKNLDINLPDAGQTACTYSIRNKECAREKCPYYDPALSQN